MGTATAASASATSSAGSPHASLPNSHAVGNASLPSPSSSSSFCAALPSAASTTSPASRNAPTASVTEIPSTSGRWKSDPADDRTHLLLYASTDASAKITPWAPAASAVRSTVPALPGSLTFASTATSRGEAPTSSASGISMNLQTASRPCGVTVWASSAITSPLTECTGTAVRATDSTSPACRDLAAGVTKSSVMAEPFAASWPSASCTACGPSARKSLDRSRNVRLARDRAALTRGERMLVTMPSTRCLLDRRPGCRWLYRGWRRSGRGGVHVGGKGLPGHSDKRREGRRICDSELGEHPAVHLDARGLQSLDEPVVGDALGASSRVDALDPEPPERALAILAVAVGIGHGMERLLLGLAVQPGALAALLARPLQHHAAPLVAT